MVVIIDQAVSHAGLLLWRPLKHCSSSCARNTDWILYLCHFSHFCCCQPCHTPRYLKSHGFWLLSLWLASKTSAEISWRMKFPSVNHDFCFPAGVKKLGAAHKTVIYVNLCVLEASLKLSFMSFLWYHHYWRSTIRSKVSNLTHL